MVHLHTSTSAGAAVSALEAPTDRGLFAPACRLSTRTSAAGSALCAPADEDGRGTAGHQPTSSCQAFNDSTTQLGMLVEDPAGLPQCMLPHVINISVARVRAGARPAACLSAAPQQPRRFSHTLMKPYARGGAYTSGATPGGRVGGSAPACAQHTVMLEPVAVKLACQPSCVRTCCPATGSRGCA